MCEVSDEPVTLSETGSDITIKAIPIAPPSTSDSPRVTLSPSVSDLTLPSSSETVSFIKTADSPDSHVTLRLGAPHRPPASSRQRLAEINKSSKRSKMCSSSPLLGEGIGEGEVKKSEDGEKGEKGEMREKGEKGEGLGVTFSASRVPLDPEVEYVRQAPPIENGLSRVVCYAFHLPTIVGKFDAAAYVVCVVCAVDDVGRSRWV